MLPDVIKLKNIIKKKEKKNDACSLQSMGGSKYKTLRSFFYIFVKKDTTVL